MSILDYVILISMILVVILILIQTRGATLGAGLGSSGEINTTRRGTDKTIFQMTIVLSLIFCVALILNVVL